MVAAMRPRAGLEILMQTMTHLMADNKAGRLLPTQLNPEAVSSDAHS